MTFNINFPLTAGIPASDVGTFQSNWSKLNSDFGIDHSAFTSATNSGFHSKVTISDVTADPIVGTIPYPGSLVYTKHDAGLTTSNLFYAAENAAATLVKIKQLTDLTLNAYANAGTAGGNGQYIDTPWGIRIIWLLTNSFAGNRTVICPAGSGNTLAYSATPNTATGSTFGGVVSVVGPPDTLTFGNTNNQQLRIIIITAI